jgi:hypothetical protein
VTQKVSHFGLRSKRWANARAKSIINRVFQFSDSLFGQWHSYEETVSDLYRFDGQLFHGDFTCLFLMGYSLQALEQYVHTILQLARP